MTQKRGELHAHLPQLTQRVRGLLVQAWEQHAVQARRGQGKRRLTRGGRRRLVHAGENQRHLESHPLWMRTRWMIASLPPPPPSMKREERVMTRRERPSRSLRLRRHAQPPPLSEYF